MTSAQNKLVRASRIWLIWLGFVLLAAHSFATWHPYSHSIDEPAGHLDSKHQVDLGDCGLCLAGAANLGGAPPLATPPLLPRLAPLPPQPMRLAPLQPAPARQPYAIRAPPVTAV